MTSHAEILNSLIAELERCERLVTALTRATEAQVITTRMHLEDGIAQIVRRDQSEPPRRQKERDVSPAAGPRALFLSAAPAPRDLPLPPRWASVPSGQQQQRLSAWTSIAVLSARARL